MTNLRGFLVPALCLVTSEVVFRLSGIRSDTLAPPSAIIGALYVAVADGTLLQATIETIESAILGLVIGGLSGAFVGVFFGLSNHASKIAFPLVEFLRAIPSVAFIPLALLFFGFGSNLGIAIVAYATFWPILILTRSAVRQVEARLIEVARLLDLDSGRLVFRVLIPSALPRIITSLRISLGIALVVSVTVEIVTNPRGLGYAMMLAQQALRPDRMFAILIWLGILGWGLNWIMLRIERWTAFGPKSSRSP